MTTLQAETSQWLASAFKNACLAELEALKPGNVHVFADGHGMVVRDFVESADATSRVIAQQGLTVGQRILASIMGTWEVVGCNTNLGIVLLCAPMVEAAFLAKEIPYLQRLDQVLQQLTVDDAALTYQAILRASPAGLGASPEHDVHVEPTVTLLGAMAEAADRDRIAYQYLHQYADVTRGAAVFNEYLQQWGWAGWATTAVYLDFLATIPDTHIGRKYGEQIAFDIMSEAIYHRDQLVQQENPKTYQRPLLDFDRDLKVRGINPGTSADLTVASLLMVDMEKMG